jgi:hypothetical protein
MAPAPYAPERSCDALTYSGFRYVSGGAAGQTPHAFPERKLLFRTKNP